MKTDLILISHNSKEDLQRFLPWIKANTSNYTLTIVDNGSEEETKEYLRKCGEKVLFQENKGYGAACNAGAKLTNSEFIVFLNCDLLCSKDWLIDLLKPFKNPLVGISGAHMIKETGEEFPTPKEGWVCGACLAIRRTTFERLAGFDENFFLFFEETDLCKRAIGMGYKVIRSEATLVHFHPHFLPMPEKLQKFYDESEKYFKEKHKNNMKKKTLALVMIAKNEEMGLQRAIDSAKPFVDEIVIAVDNSSTDKTAFIAAQNTENIKLFDFKDDFAAARNFAHEEVKSDWILFLDGHEYIEKCQNLEKYLESEEDALMCSIEMETGMIFHNTRIYKNGIKFEGKVHERTATKTVKNYPDILIKHDRKTGQAPEAIAIREQQRDDQINRIMGGDFKKNKKDTRSAFHLALHSQSKGDFKDAINWWKKYLKFSKEKGARWYAYFNISLCQMTLGNFWRAFRAASLANEEVKDKWEIAKLKGMILFQKQSYRKAMIFLVDSFKINTGDVSYKPWKRDDGGTFNMIGECLFNTGFYDKAAEAFSKAAELSNDKMIKDLLLKRSSLMTEIFKSKYNG